MLGLFFLAKNHKLVVTGDVCIFSGIVVTSLLYLGAKPIKAEIVFGDFREEFWIQFE